MTAPIVKRADSYRGYRIAPTDTNYMIPISDPIQDGVSFTLLLEVYAVGGKTPPNSHAGAHELFFILKGEGRAYCDGHETGIGPGDTVLLPPGTEHVIANTGPGKLYALCLMVPNEDFAEMIHAGTPVPLDAEDLAVLSGAMLSAQGLAASTARPA